MNDDKMSIPYIAFEGELARAERHIKRLWIVNIILILKGLSVWIAPFLFIYAKNQIIEMCKKAILL